MVNTDINQSLYGLHQSSGEAVLISPAAPLTEENLLEFERQAGYSGPPNNVAMAKSLLVNDTFTGTASRSTIVDDPSPGYFEDRLSRYSIKVVDYAYEDSVLSSDTLSPLRSPALRNPFQLLAEYEFLLGKDSNMDLEEWWFRSGTDLEVRSSIYGSTFYATRTPRSETSSSNTLLKDARQLPIPGEVSRSLLDLGWVTIEEASARWLEKDWVSLAIYDCGSPFQLACQRQRFSANFQNRCIRPWVPWPPLKLQVLWAQSLRSAFDEVAASTEVNRPYSSFRTPGEEPLPVSNITSISEADVVDTADAPSAEDLADSRMFVTAFPHHVKMDQGAQCPSQAVSNPAEQTSPTNFIPTLKDRKAALAAFGPSLQVMHYYRLVGLSLDRDKSSQREHSEREHKQESVDYGGSYDDSAQNLTVQRPVAELWKTTAQRLQDEWQAISESVTLFEQNLWWEGIQLLKRRGLGQELLSYRFKLHSSESTGRICMQPAAQLMTLPIDVSGLQKEIKRAADDDASDIRRHEKRCRALSPGEVRRGR